MINHVGFTGTRDGMQPNQKLELAEYLRFLKEQGYTHLHHGDCIGADAQAAKLAKELGFFVIAHPGQIRDPNNTMYRAFTDFNDEVKEPKPTKVRDRDIVDAADVMIAAPWGEEVLRSGTWCTVRHARKKQKSIHIIYPSKKK